MDNPGGGNLAKFDPSDTSTVSSRWKKWKRGFEIFLEVNNITIPARKRSYLLHYAGNDVQDIFFSLRGDEELIVPADSDIYKVSLKLLDDYFLPLKCLPRERHIFRNLEQAPDESIEKFVLRLREQGNLCDYGDWLEENLKEQIFEKGYSDELRSKILTKPNMTLTQTVEMGRSLETIAKHRKNLTPKAAAQLPPKEDVNSVTDSSSGSKGKCYRCGQKGHYANNDECPARNHKCERCHLVGHYPKCCNTKSPRNDNDQWKKKKRPKGKVRQVESDDASEDRDSDDSEDECVDYVFATGPKGSEKVYCEVGGITLGWMIDSGAGVNVISEDTWKYLKDNKVKVDYHTDQVKKKLMAYGNHRLVVKGMFIAQISTKSSSVSDKVFVVKEGGSNLLGREAATKLGILKIDTSICAVDPQESRIGKVKGVIVSVRIDPSVKPVQHTQSRIPIPLQPKVERELKRLLKEEIIEHAPRDSPWISRLVIRLKPGTDDIRLCVDMRDANKAIVPKRHPLPTFDDIVPHLHNCKVFSKVDLRKAFHQVELAEEARGITTFAAHNGYYRYMRLTLGMNCASELFQSVIERVLAGIPGVKMFIDDILIFGANKAEHDRALAAVLERLKESGMTINEEKCQLGRSEVTFMGHRLSSEGICPTDEKVDSIRRFRSPETVEELRSFLGLINYLGKFIPNLSTHTAPLRELLHKDVKFKWTTVHDKAFEKLKAEVADPKNLGYYSPHDETIVVADASPVGIGAVLLQVKDGKKRAICYISKGLSPAEKAYAQNEREALALVWAVERLEQYLRGLKFQLVTDHEPLKVLFGENKKCPRIERWAVRLQSFRYRIVHIPGKANIADPLSRLPEFRNCSTYDQLGESMLLSIIDSAKPTALTIEELQGKTLSDPELAAVKEALNIGRWKDSLKPYFAFREELLVVNEIVMRGERIVVPISLRQRVLKLAHIGHPGIERTKQRLRSKVWWPGIDKEAEKTVKACLDCQLVSGNPSKEPLSIREIPSSPWNVLAMDMLGPLPSQESILVVIDLYSRYRVTEVLTSTTSEEIIKCLSRLFYRFGFPAVLLSDNAKNFSSHTMEQFCRRFGIQLKHTTPYWPQANGEVERQNRTILKSLKISQVNGTDWKADLEEANYVYSLIQHPATGRSPAEMVFGRKVRDWIPQLNSTVAEGDVEVKDNDLLYRNKAKVQYDAAHNVKESDLQPHDQVLMRNLVPQNKLSPLYHPKPATVLEKSGNSVLVQTEDGRTYRRNSSHLKKVQENKSADDDSSHSNWATPASVSASCSSTPIPETVQGNLEHPHAGAGRPRRETKRPLRFEDYEMDI